MLKSLQNDFSLCIKLFFKGKLYTLFGTSFLLTSTCMTCLKNLLHSCFDSCGRSMNSNQLRNDLSCRGMPQEENTYMNYVMYLYKSIACKAAMVATTITKCKLKRRDFKIRKNFQRVRLLKS